MNFIKKASLSIIFLTAIFQNIIFANTSPISQSQYNNTLSKNFKTPADSNHLWCYWYWINDDISKEGITKDLTAMKQAGIGTALIGNINPPEQNGKVPLFSDKWWQCMVHAVTEGKRLGVDIGTFNCPGWSQSGGPWVKPEMAMRYLTYSETSIQGPGKITANLPQPKSEFQDVYVLAIPDNTNYKTLDNTNSRITITPAVKDSNNWFDHNMATTAAFEAKAQSSYTIEFQANSPITARSLICYPSSQPLAANCEVFAFINNEYKLIKTFNYERSNHSVNVGPLPQGPVAIALPETSSDKFKFVLHNLNIPQGIASLKQISLSEKPVLDSYIEKQLGKMFPTPLPMWGSYIWNTQPSVSEKLFIPKNEVIDISNKMDKNGNLNWNAPQGKWTIMRIGMTPTGTTNAPAAPQGKGYEIDKANEELIRFHFEQYVGELLKRIPDESKDALKYIVMDSYEMGSQNWTDDFEKSFEKRYGYNPKKWLPVLSGAIIGSIEESDRFLWDLRRAVADDVAYEYVGGLKKICNENNLQSWLENYGHWGFPSEFLMYGGQSDLVSGEFWNEGTLGNIECKSASSCVHIYNKKRCFAEAFTSAGNHYIRHPAMLKKRGDWSFTEGVNQFVLHLYIHQPDDSRIPGINAWFATEFNRHNTWFKQSRNWMDYNRRCQQLLQQGSYVADVCYFISENTPKMTGVRIPELPQGYSYDYINAEVILKNMSVKDGKLVLPWGTSYSLMVLPPLDTMRPAVIEKLEELVKQGGAIYGPKPVKSPSLENYPACDQQVLAAANRLWGSGYIDGELSHSYGKGTVYNKVSLDAVLQKLGITKDLSMNNNSVLWTHRTAPGMDIYFLTNQSDNKISINPKFRTVNGTPQLWDAETGEIRILNDFQKTVDGITTPVTMEPAQSMFIVFTDKAPENIHKGYTKNFPAKETYQTLDKKWNVQFNNPVIAINMNRTFDKLIDWTKSDDDKIKYYSGTAAYITEFDIDQVAKNKDYFINLGRVGVMAEVTVNGKLIGGTWIAPYTLDITDFIKPGKNTLKIEVVNQWRNYLIKEEGKPQQERKTTLLVNDTSNNEPLQPAGLIGPVTIETIDKLN